MRSEQKGKPKLTPNSKKAKPISKNVKPKKRVAFKGERLSAAYYFHEVCGNKISRCRPQVITEQNGRSKLKEIKSSPMASRGSTQNGFLSKRLRSRVPRPRA
jgi:hypothetical protein